MKEKDTRELVKILKETHISEYEAYIDENSESILSEANSFSTYIKDLIAKNNLTQQIVFLHGDIPERYGYKLLSGEKRTKQRDVILRICYGAKLTLDQTQEALKKYGMAELYAKNKRDALLMIAFNERTGSIIDVNTMLKEYGFEALRTSGVQE